MLKNLKRADLFVMVCNGSKCKKKGAKSLARTAKRTLKDEEWFRRAQILRIKCTGNCKSAPVCGVLPQGEWLAQAKDDGLRRLIVDTIAAHDEES